MFVSYQLIEVVKFNNFIATLFKNDLINQKVSSVKKWMFKVLPVLQKGCYNRRRIDRRISSLYSIPNQFYFEFLAYFYNAMHKYNNSFRVRINIFVYYRWQSTREWLKMSIGLLILNASWKLCLTSRNKKMVLTR